MCGKRSKPNFFNKLDHDKELILIFNQSSLFGFCNFRISQTLSCIKSRRNCIYSICDGIFLGGRGGEVRDFWEIVSEAAGGDQTPSPPSSDPLYS